MRPEQVLWAMQKSSFLLPPVGFPFADEFSGDEREPNDDNGNDTNTSSQDFTILELIIMIGVPVVVLALLILFIIFLVKYLKRRRLREEDIPASENIKSPIFEEDTRSVMEIEMEELDMWMSSTNKNVTMIPESNNSCLSKEGHYF
ncbi:transmembrane protein 154 isoform X2 [Rhinatrema bivittatum]|uniref:transmembrane protein 154 isoform X2 n=1 Tax=Rhinatrema bivittatum TaxID=194408 RepID=UPI001129BCD1|nr:transmembrane protein 154 isoform X2 [Rhinatrema bivittatum]